MVTTLINPERYTLDEQQLAAALALGQIVRGPHSGLPELAAPADPAGLLRGTPLLRADGQLQDGCRAALAVLAGASRAVSLAANVAGSPIWIESVVVHGAADGPYVAHPGGGRYDLALLPALMDAVLYVDELLSITAGPSQVGEEAVSLGLPGLAAFAALADAVQRAKLQALLAREFTLQSTWTAAELGDLLAAGLASDDTRWATTAIRHTAPVPLEDAASALADGLAELVRTGLAAPADAGWTLTPAGYTRAAAFGQLVNAGAISLAALDAGGQPTAMSASVFRTVLGVWLLTWTVSSGSARAELEEVTAGQALELVRAMLRASDPLPAAGGAQPAAPAAPAGFCPNCGGAVNAGARFCMACGRPLASV